jgi:hypothetical protein
LFEHVLASCRRVGLIAGDVLLLDSTEVGANASPESVTSLHYDHHDYFGELDRNAADAELPSASAKASDASADDEDDSSGMGTRRPRASKLSDCKRSTTDPDATLSSRGGSKSRPAFKTHTAVDPAEGVVTAVEVSDAATDDTAMAAELVESHERQLGRPKKVVADALYGSHELLGHLQEDKSITTVIRQRRGGNKHGGYAKRMFHYDLDRDRYTCPAGQTLIRRRTQKGNPKRGVGPKAFYHCDPSTCQACPCRNACLGSAAARRMRTITRFDTPYVHRAEAACATASGKRLLKRRQTCIEGVFGRAKSQHGLARARWRGLTNMTVQALLTMTVMNLKKLMNALPKDRSHAMRRRLSALFVRLNGRINAQTPPNPIQKLQNAISAAITKKAAPRTPTVQ